jgi:hypothetical protein
MVRSFFVGVFVSVLAMSTLVTLVKADDTVPPDITNVEVIDVTETSVKIKWETDENADSLINYGLQEDYGIVHIPVADRKAHEIILEGLDSGRVYHFRVVSSDIDGNQGISADYKVQTDGTSEIGTETQVQQQDSTTVQQQSQSQQQTQQEITQQVTQEIQKISDVTLLKEILNETVKAIQGITEDLTIVGPPTVIVETNSATVSWTTDREADSTVVFSPSASYIADQYAFSQSSTDGPTTNHEIKIIGLEPYTEYHFKVKSVDGYGILGESRDYTFRTKATRPDIRNLRILKVEEDSATLAWDTTVPAKALIEYQDLTTGKQNSIGRPTLASSHQMRISDLTLGSRYVAFVIAENAGGDRVKSNPITFITARDREPPIITNVTNDSTLFPGSEARIQTIVEWKTDEPSYCSMSYREGITGGVEPTIVASEDISYVTEHIEVIIDFAPATVYQFWLTCADEAGNSVDSENFVLFTPIQEKNIIDIIIENFQSTFGWVKNIGGGG